MYRLLYYNKILNRDPSWDSDSGICRITGFFNLFFEFLCFLYIAFLSYIMKKMIVDPTCNFSVLTLVSHFVSCGMTLVMLVLVGVFFGFGLSVSTTCGFIPLDFIDMWH